MVSEPPEGRAAGRLRPGVELAGRYRLVERLGQGGMGEVWKAVDTNIDEPVALKVLLPDLKVRGDRFTLLRDETRISHMLKHPFIVHVRDVDQDDDLQFITMDFVDGPSLARAVERRGPLPLAEVLGLARGMCADVDYAHARGIIHRDIKPGNFLVDEDARAKLSDFDMARRVEYPRDALRLEDRSGTLPYMSPEQLSAAKIDWRTDIYSLGVTLYELLNGSPPFAAGNIADRILNEPVPDIPGIPQHINEALKRAMAKQPVDRWQSAAALLQALKGPPLPAAAGELPEKLTPFFGRESELGQLRRLFFEEGRRLVTLTGPAGSGKTRLAIEFARQVMSDLRGNVWYVALQGLADPAVMPAALARALGKPSPAAGQTAASLAPHLPDEQSLLVLDNFERLVEGGAARLAGLLRRAPLLWCLVTSRRVLNVKGEHEVEVLPLEVPTEAEGAAQLLKSPSAAMFVDRARRVSGSFRVTDENAACIGEICRRLEGVPLAIELAASRARLFTPATMLRALERRLDFLRSRLPDATPRHRTMRAALDWSFEQLNEPLGRFLARLTVFRGGWTAQAAAEVCGEPKALDCLAQLRERSLVRVHELAEAPAVVRFGMLECVREYAEEQLPDQQKAALAERHARHYLSVAEGAADRRALGGLRADRDNFHAALNWFANVGGRDDAIELLRAILTRLDREGPSEAGRGAARH